MCDFANENEMYIFHSLIYNILHIPLNYSELNCNFVCTRARTHTCTWEIFKQNIYIYICYLSILREKIINWWKKQFLYSQRVSIYIWIILIFRNHCIKSTTDAIFNEIIIISLSVSFFSFVLFCKYICTYIHVLTWLHIYIYIGNVPQKIGAKMEVIPTATI